MAVENDREEVLHELEALIDSSFDGFYVTDSEGICLRVNKAYERLSGYPAHVFIGRPIETLVQEGYIGRSVVPDVLSKVTQCTIVNHNRNGKRLLSTGTPIFDQQGRIWRVVCNIRDITELVELQSALDDTQELAQYYRESLERMRLADSPATPDGNGLIWRSRAMDTVVQACLRVARTDSPVLLHGESGVGKEVVADLIHAHSPRAAQPLVKVNCGAIPENLMESEFFGYDSGAFTGAQVKGKPGLFELANNGTLFLDEVGELPLTMQPKLLRALQDFQILRVGGVRQRKVDVRILCASNQNLEEMCRLGRFRWDLYYRLNVIPVIVPPLRERREDIPVLVRHFLQHFGGKTGSTRTISVDAMDALIAYPWPGNVRELRNMVERLVVLSDGERIELGDLPRDILLQAAPVPGGAASRWSESRQVREVQLIEQAVREHGSLRQAAKALGVSHSTLSRRMRQGSGHEHLPS